MIKAAFIVMFPGLDHNTYNASFETSNSRIAFYGVSSVDETELVLKELAADGYTVFNFCSAYKDEYMERFIQNVGPQYSYEYVRFEGYEKDKFLNTKDFSEFGLILGDRNVVNTESIRVEGALNTEIRLVGSVEAAIVAAKELEAGGTKFMELCSWFDLCRYKKVVYGACSQVPIGRCYRKSSEIALQYAFIVWMPGLRHQDYQISCEKGTNQARFIGVSDMQEAAEVCRELAADGVQLIDLCGSFDAGTCQELRQAAPGPKYCYMQFTGDEAAKLEASDDWSVFGVLIHDAGIAETAAFEIEGDFHSSIRFVRDMDAACPAAKELIASGATFIEMCSWFDQEKYDAIVAAADTQRPIGTAGLPE